MLIVNDINKSLAKCKENKKNFKYIQDMLSHNRADFP